MGKRVKFCLSCQYLRPKAYFTAGNVCDECVSKLIKSPRTQITPIQGEQNIIPGLDALLPQVFGIE